MNRIVITHPEQGIYVGCAMGLGFWSMWEAAGQESVAVFETEEQAREHIRSWENGSDDNAYGYVSVETVHDGYASMDELKAAGLEHLLGDLMSSLATVPGMGHA